HVQRRESEDDGDGKAVFWVLEHRSEGPQSHGVGLLGTHLSKTGPRALKLLLHEDEESIEPRGTKSLKQVSMVEPKGSVVTKNNGLERHRATPGAQTGGFITLLSS